MKREEGLGRLPESGGTVVALQTVDDDEESDAGEVPDMAGNEQQERAAQQQEAFEQRGPAHQVVLPDRRESDEAEHDGNRR